MTRAIFLAFVNRELLQVRGVRFDEGAHIALIKNCGMMSAGHLVMPYAQVSELYWGSKKINSLIEILCKLDKLHLRNGLSDRYNFLESRRNFYGEHQKKYPMYFGKKIDNSHEYIYSDRINTTRFIKDKIIESVRDISRNSNIISAEEALRLKDNSDFILGDLLSGPAAATFSTYGSTSIAPKPAEVKFFGDLSCRLFVSHYSNEYDLVVPTGFFNDPLIENQDQFPFFDIKINDLLLKKLNLIDIIYDMEFHQPFINFVLDSGFSYYCEVRAKFFDVLLSSARLRSGDSSRIYAIIAKLNEMPFDSGGPSKPQSAAAVAEHLKNVMTRASQRDREIAAAMEQVGMGKRHQSPILVFTATDLEDEVFKASAVVNGFTPIDLSSMDGFTAGIYRSAAGSEILHVRTSAGTSGVHGSARISEAAISQIAPRYVVSVGIAFGVDEKSQSLGDVLVSEYVFSYEKIKISPDKVEWRGDKIPTDASAVSFGRQYHFRGRGFKAIVGGILSGDKLVNDPDFRAQIVSLDPKAVGGEMEASGLAQSCLVKGVPFAMVKGISDWGIGKDDKLQKTAAQNAFQLAFDLIKATQGAQSLGDA